MKRTFALLPYFLVLLLPALSASAEMVSIQVEPIIGYELVQKLVPVPHTHNRILYGARVTAGVLLVSAEAEYTRGTDQETFDTGLVTNDQADRLKIGLRSGVSLGQLLSARVRGGVQATQNTHSDTVGGITSTTIQPITYKPYAGAGLTAGLTSKISASADVVVVFNNTNDMSQNEYQTTAGFSIRFP